MALKADLLKVTEKNKKVRADKKNKVLEILFIYNK